MLEPLPKALEKCYIDNALIYQDDSSFYYNTNFNEDLLEDIKTHNFQIYNGTYRHNQNDGSTTIWLVGRGRKSGKQLFPVQGYYPYCYVYDEKGEHKTYQGRRVEKLIFETEPRHVADLRKQYERKDPENVPCEADVPFVSRFLIDTYDFFKPTEYIEPKVAIFDLETNYPVNSNVISYALNSYDGDLIFTTQDDVGKYEIALDAYNYLKEHDIIGNLNIEFDISALEKNIQKFKMAMRPLEDGYEMSYSDYVKVLSLDYNMFGIPTSESILKALIKYKFLNKNGNGIITYGKNKFLFDLNLLGSPFEFGRKKGGENVIKKMLGHEISGRWNLDNIGTKIVGTPKIDVEGKYPRALTYEELLVYNTRDVIIPELVDNYLGCIDAHVILAWHIQQMIKDTIKVSRVNDIALLRAYHRAGIVLPSKLPYTKGDEEDEATYKAAEPQARPGVYENIVAVDINAAYSTAVLAVNASCETKDKNGKYQAPNGVRFNDGKSVFIDTLKELMVEKRKVKAKLKKLRRGSTAWKTQNFIHFAIKTQVAAFSHGIFGWKKSRMPDLEVADAITSVVRGALDLVKDYVDSKKHDWVYVHTDSVYFNATKEEAESMLKELNKVLEDYCNDMGYSVPLVLDYKGFFPLAYIHSPARNVLIPEDGSLSDSDTWEVTGCNFIRSEVAEPLANIEIALISMKIKGASDEERLDYLADAINKLKGLDTRTLGVVKPLTKAISRYGRIGKDGKKCGIPYHITALTKANEDYGFKVKVGQKFLVIPIILDEWTGVRVRRRKKGYMAYSFEEGLPDMYEVDWDTYLRSNLWGKIAPLFDCKPKELEEKVCELCEESERS